MGCNTEMKICSYCEHARGPTVTLLTVLKRRARSTAKPQFSNIIMVDTVIATPEQLQQLTSTTFPPTVLQKKSLLHIKGQQRTVTRSGRRFCIVAMGRFQSRLRSTVYTITIYAATIDPIDYVTGIGNAHSNQYKIFAHSALWCWSSSPRSELENSVSWTAEVRLS